MAVIFNVVHTDISHTRTLSSVCVHVVSHLTAAVTTADGGGNKPKLSVN